MGPVSFHPAPSSHDTLPAGPFIWTRNRTRTANRNRPNRFSIRIRQLIGKATKQAHNQSTGERIDPTILPLLDALQKQRKQGQEADQRSAEQPKATEKGPILVGQKVAEESEHSSPKLTHEQMLAAFDSYEAKSMDEYKKIIDLTEEEQEELENEEPEEEVDNQEPEEKLEQKKRSKRKMSNRKSSKRKKSERLRTLETVCSPFYNSALAVCQGLGWKLPLPSSSCPKNQLQQELC